jgi:hypothetical protein
MVHTGSASMTSKLLLLRQSYYSITHTESHLEINTYTDIELVHYLCNQNGLYTNWSTATANRFRGRDKSARSAALEIN